MLTTSRGHDLFRDGVRWVTFMVMCYTNIHVPGNFISIFYDEDVFIAKMKINEMKLE